MKKSLQKFFQEISRREKQCLMLFIIVSILMPIVHAAGVNGRLNITTIASAEEGQIYIEEIEVLEEPITTTPPPAPSIASTTPTSITLAPINAPRGWTVEYRLNHGAWQAHPEFGNLTPNTTYTFTARFSGNTINHIHTEAGESIRYATLPLPEVRVIPQIGGVFTDENGMAWRVLAEEGNYTLIITEHVFGHGTPYHNTNVYARLSNSHYLRPALNQFWRGISEEIRSRAVPANGIDNDVRSAPGGWELTENLAVGRTTPNGNEVEVTAENTLYILSLSEVNEYFANHDDRIATDVEGTSRNWWLRTPGGNLRNPVAFVNSSGVIASTEATDGTEAKTGFRPALWIYIPNDAQEEAAQEEIAIVQPPYLIGFEDGEIRPEVKITRAEIATILYRLMPESRRANYSKTTTIFRDMNGDEWFVEAISVVTNAGIFHGNDHEHFNPDDSIARNELAAVMARFVGKDEASYGGTWSESYMHFAELRGWMKNTDAYSLVTRAEAVAAINRMTNRVNAYDPESNTHVWVDNTNSQAWFYLDIQSATNPIITEQASDETNGSPSPMPEIISNRSMRAFPTIMAWRR